MNNDTFEKIKDEQLSSVTFVQDYLQLDFDGIRLTLHVWPTVYLAQTKWTINNSGYRDQLCSIIARNVATVLFVEDFHLEIFFEDNYRINIPLNPDNPDIASPELLIYSDRQNNEIII